LKRQKVLLIGWDAADWKVINPLMDAGLMPALNQLVDQGVIGDLETLEPALSPMLWTSIATGKTADKHGVLGFVETDEQTRETIPTTVASRKCKALWNILNDNDYKCNVFNWWPSHPAEKIKGVMVSNFFNQSTTNYGEDWPVSHGAVHPISMLETLKEMRVHAQEITPEIIFQFIPAAVDCVKDLTEEDYKKIERIKKYLAQCVSTHAQTTWALENTEWDFTAVYYETIDKFCHSFMQFTAPKMEKVEVKDFDLYQYVINAIYVFHDMMLERLLHLAGEDTTVMLLSDHGFHSGNLRPKALPKHHASIALQHNPQGVFLMKGIGIKKDERISSGNLLDVVPTLLAHLGLPVGRDMDGKVLHQVFDNKMEVKYIMSWDEEGEHPPPPSPVNRRVSSEGDAVVLQQLMDLGYIIPQLDKEEQYNETKFNNQYHLSVVLRTTNRKQDALNILEALYMQDMVDTRVNLDLIGLYAELDQLVKARNTLEMFKKLNIEKLVDFEMLEIQVLRAGKNTEQAIDGLEKIIKRRGDHFQALLELANCYRIVRNYKKAKEKYELAMQLHPDHHVVQHGMGVCLLKEKEYERAVDQLLTSIGLHFNAPACHFHLGEALIGLASYNEAASAFETAIYLNPEMNRARSLLVDVYRNQLQNEAKAKEHEAHLKRKSSRQVVVVSGLPRSGTSMMMQLLEAGGVPIYADGIRQKDENNPKGYYESEKTKTIDRRNGWLEEALGCAVKIVAPLLKHLKLKYTYKVIFMERDLNQVLLSQQKMKKRLKLNENPDVNYYDLKLATAYKNELKRIKKWEQQHANVELLRVNYLDVIQHPSREIERIQHFLEMELCLKEMPMVIDTNLYRERV
jgi:predicted AlkP superfamily phosphohydrolase/phosphomutase/tetratricopeptide (TPR) repeat protein